METIKRDRVRVIYRTDKRGTWAGHVTAIFPDQLEGCGHYGCYAHIGQHGIASRQWMLSDTRPALAEEFADLHRELTGIYSDCELVICKRFPSYRSERQ